LLAFAAGVVYDTLFIIPLEGLRSLLAAGMVACLGATVVLAKFPQRVVQPALLAAWPLHLFTICFVVTSWCFHGGAMMGTIIAYTIVAYATYLLVPICLMLDHRLLVAFVKMVAIASALLALPSMVGALGMESILGIPLRNKYSYSSFSGIIASGGVFEHPEGHALQMAVGLMCCFYALRKSGNPLYGICLLLTFAGLIVSQGRGAIFGVVIAVVFCFLPELFRRSRPVFLGSLALCLVFPFLIWPQIGKIPGVSEYLRIERGLSGRDVAWQYAFSLVEEKPWTGHGFETSRELSAQGRKLLRKSGYSGAGTTFHNTFITKAVELGMIALVSYTLLYLVPLIRICIPTNYALEQQLVRNILLLTLTASLFRDYNIGGVRSTSMMVAVFWGLANFWPLAASFEQASQNASDQPALPEQTPAPSDASPGRRRVSILGPRGS
jgi:O-antigen ligase